MWTFESYLKDLAAGHFEVSWRYEVMTNSILLRLEKLFNHRWYKLERRICFEEIGDDFEFCMVQYMRKMEIELDVAAGVCVPSDEEEGESVCL